MTLEAWVNPSTASNAWRDVIYKGNDNYFLEARLYGQRSSGGGWNLCSGFRQGVAGGEHLDPPCGDL